MKSIIQGVVTVRKQLGPPGNWTWRAEHSFGSIWTFSWWWSVQWLRLNDLIGHFWCHIFRRNDNWQRRKLEKVVWSINWRDILIPVFQGLKDLWEMTNDRESKDPLVLGLLTLLSHQPLMSRRHLLCSYYTVSTTSMGGLLLYPRSGLIWFVLVLSEFFIWLKNKSQQMCATVLTH